METGKIPQREVKLFEQLPAPSGKFLRPVELEADHNRHGNPIGTHGRLIATSRTRDGYDVRKRR
jgi:hypothetical protein